MHTWGKKETKIWKERKRERKKEKKKKHGLVRVCVGIILTKVYCLFSIKVIARIEI